MPWALLISLLWLGPLGARVEWGGDGSCPGAERVLERALDDYLGEGVTDASHVVAEISVVEAGGRGIELHLTIASEAGHEQHELVGLACEPLVDQAALLLAGVIDPFMWAAPMPTRHEGVSTQRPIQRPIQRPLERPIELGAITPRDDGAGAATLDAELERDVPAPATKLDEPAEPVESRPRADDRPSRPARARAVVGTIGAGATSFVGLFPRPGGGVQVDGGLERERFRWQAAAAGYFGGRFRAEGADIGGDLSALGISTSFCGMPDTTRVRVRLCGSAGAGFVSARAVGTNTAGRSTQPWAQAGGEFGLVVAPRRRVAFVLGVGVHAALVRPSWEVRSPDEIFAVPPLMGLLRASMEIRGLGGDQNTRR